MLSSECEGTLDWWSVVAKCPLSTVTIDGKQTCPALQSRAIRDVTEINMHLHCI
jgi:hypothetical protein